MGKRVTVVPQLSYLLLRGGLFGIGQVSVALLDFTFCSFLIVASCFHRSGYVFFRNPLVILDRPTIPFDQIVRLGIRRRNCVFAYLKPRWICCDICTGPVLFAQGVTGLATCSQGYLSYKLTGPVLLAQGITGLAALSHSQSYLSCKLTAWSCLLKELLVLQLAHRVTYLATHRPGLACSRDYWSCSPQPLTELPVLQTHDLVLLLKELLVLQLQLAHRITYLADSRLDSLVGPTARSTETCSRQRNLLYVSDIDNWCPRGLIFCRLWVAMLVLSDDSNCFKRLFVQLGN
jgi:hypothetical protein